MPKNKIIYVLLSCTISIFLLGFLFSQIQIKDLLQTLSKISYPFLFAFMAISLLAAVLRAFRYKWLLHPESIGTGQIFLVTLIRNLFVDLLPARIGSLSYIYLLNKRLNFPFETAASTFVVAFVFDFLTLSPFLVLAIFAVGLGSSSVSTFDLLFVAALFFGLVFFILWKLIPLSRIFLRVFQAFTKAFSAQEKKFSRTAVNKIQLTVDSLARIQKRRIYWPLFFLSLCIRLAKYVSLYLLLVSLLKSHGLGLVDLSFWKTILGTTGAELTSALPIKGIGGFGTWESAWALTFKLMNFDSRLAILSGLGVHLITNLYEYMLGILSLLILALPWLKNRKKVGI